MNNTHETYRKYYKSIPYHLHIKVMHVMCIAVNLYYKHNKDITIYKSISNYFIHDTDQFLNTNTLIANVYKIRCVSWSIGFKVNTSGPLGITMDVIIDCDGYFTHIQYGYSLIINCLASALNALTTLSWFLLSWRSSIFKKITV